MTREPELHPRKADLSADRGCVGVSRRVSAVNGFHKRQARGWLRSIRCPSRPALPQLDAANCFQEV